jgi:hypothetical protein
VLLALALDYEDGAKLSLEMQLNCLRVLADNREGVAQRELQPLTGLSKEAISGLVNPLGAARRADTPRRRSARADASARRVALVSDGVTPGRLSGRQLIR